MDDMGAGIGGRGLRGTMEIGSWLGDEEGNRDVRDR